MSTQAQTAATQGPWLAIDEGDCFHITARKGALIATVHGGRADAALIEAAPEMAEALRALMEFWDNGTPVHAGAEVVADARSALAKLEAGQ